ncbi:MAG TPA: pantoate--beta-alanine ligase [Stellaceae bacterium]|jgi:pantoate--beta-alanine ligase|nr:pantoate--beta-alanine ligase [Stellaceae bacterium]
MSAAISAKPSPTGIKGLPTVARSRVALRGTVERWKREHKTIGVVPTMGALHEGHLTLVRRAQSECDRVIVTIFVNPTQFGPNEDFGAYPRRETQDMEKLSTLGVALVWLPTPEEMYPEGFATTVSVANVTDGLCAPHRPGHFQGVATVVTKLLNQTGADKAYFGEKDYQQLQVIKRLARDLDLPCEIIGVPTVREADGLALSSRNLYLAPTERAQAALLPQVLRETADAAARGEAPFPEIVDRAIARLIEGGFGSIDYLAICDAETLAPVSDLARPARIFVAARLGKTRLIDNMPIPSPSTL